MTFRSGVGLVGLISHRQEEALRPRGTWLPAPKLYSLGRHLRDSNASRDWWLKPCHWREVALQPFEAPSARECPSPEAGFVVAGRTSALLGSAGQFLEGFSGNT